MPFEVDRIMHRSRTLRERLLDEMRSAQPDHLLYRQGQRWSVRDTLVHIGNWEEEAVTYLRHMVRGEAPPFQDITDIDQWNAEALARYASLDVAGAVEYLDRVRWEYEEVVELITEEHLKQNAQFIPLLNMCPDHESGHLFQVREVLARARGDEIGATLAYLGYARDRLLLRVNLDSRPVAALDWRPAPEKWSTREILIHLAIWDRWLAEWVAAVADGRERVGAPFAEGELDTWNREQVAANAHCTLSEVLHELGSARGAVEEQIRRLQPAQLADPDVQENIKGFREHDDQHMMQIIERLKGWRASLT